MRPDRVTRIAEFAYNALILAVAAVVWREASGLPPAPYDPLGPKSFPIWVCGGLILLAAAMLVRLACRRALGSAGHAMVIGLEGGAHAASPWSAGLTLLLAMAYAGALGSSAVPFVLATAVYLFAASAVLGPLHRRRIAVVAAFAIAAAAALDLLFRVVFKLDLA
jgi:hypothetical protein